MPISEVTLPFLRRCQHLVLLTLHGSSLGSLAAPPEAPHSTQGSRGLAYTHTHTDANMFKDLNVILDAAAAVGKVADIETVRECWEATLEMGQELQMRGVLCLLGCQGNKDVVLDKLGFRGSARM